MNNQELVTTHEWPSRPSVGQWATALKGPHAGTVGTVVNEYFHYARGRPETEDDLILLYPTGGAATFNRMELRLVKTPSQLKAFGSRPKTHVPDAQEPLTREEFFSFVAELAKELRRDPFSDTNYRVGGLLQDVTNNLKKSDDGTENG